MEGGKGDRHGPFGSSQVGHLVAPTVDVFLEEVVEVGAGRVLAGLVKRIDRSLTASSIGGPAELEELMKRL